MAFQSGAGLAGSAAHREVPTTKAIKRNSGFMRGEWHEVAGNRKSEQLNRLDIGVVNRCFFGKMLKMNNLQIR